MFRFSYSLEGVHDDGDDQNNSDGESINASSELDAEDKTEEEDIEEEEYYDSESEDKADHKEEDVENYGKEKEEMNQIELRNPAEAEVEGNEDCSNNSSNEESSDNEECAMDDLTDLMPSFDMTSVNSTKRVKEESRKSETCVESEDKQEMCTRTNTIESKCEVELDLPYVIKGKLFILSLIIVTHFIW